MSALEPDQREYLQNQLVRSRRTAFANAMAKAKGFHIAENTDPDEIEVLLDEWKYTGYIDAGKVSSELRCECGRPLRYQHHVEHKTSGEKKRFGIEHLKEHLGIDAATVAEVLKGFDAIDYELDELLLKINGGWQPNPELLQRAGTDIPDDVKIHLKLKLPLLERQIRKLGQLRLRKRVTAAPSILPVKAEMTHDLFSWNEEPRPSARAYGASLDSAWRDPVRAYLTSGVRSARVICELLISERNAPNDRMLTGKPMLYLQVCRFIEEVYPEAIIQMQGTDDRIYEI
ncbi:DUF3895 domain-containing protein [Cohnella endophytica]|nr:DUF3895 domain-containing protein [Cohnella endophytica]